MGVGSLCATPEWCANSAGGEPSPPLAQAAGPSSGARNRQSKGSLQPLDTPRGAAEQCQGITESSSWGLLASRQQPSLPQHPSVPAEERVGPPPGSDCRPTGSAGTDPQSPARRLRETHKETTMKLRAALCPLLPQLVPRGQLPLTVEVLLLDLSRQNRLIPSARGEGPSAQKHSPLARTGRIRVRTGHSALNVFCAHSDHLST